MQRSSGRQPRGSALAALAALIGVLGAPTLAISGPAVPAAGADTVVLASCTTRWASCRAPLVLDVATEVNLELDNVWPGTAHVEVCIRRPWWGACEARLERHVVGGVTVSEQGTARQLLAAGTYELVVHGRGHEITTPIDVGTPYLPVPVPQYCTYLPTWPYPSWYCSPGSTQQSVPAGTHVWTIDPSGQYTARVVAADQSATTTSSSTTTTTTPTTTTTTQPPPDDSERFARKGRRVDR